MYTVQFDIHAIHTAWQAFDSLASLRSIHNEADYDHMTALMNSLLDAVGNDEDHTLSGLLDLVGDLVRTYEHENYDIEPPEPALLPAPSSP